MLDSLPGGYSLDVFQNMRVETYTNMAAASLLVYDCILTIHDEITLIWPSRLNLVKILFFLTRYMAFVDVSLVLYYQLKPQITVHECEIVYKLAGWFILIGIIIAETILLVRTWAIWGRGSKLAISFLILFALAAGPALAIQNMFMNSIVFAPLSNPATPGCLVVAGSPVIAISFIIVIIIETIVLILTLIKAIQHCKLYYSHCGILTEVFTSVRLTGRQDFLSVLYRDGLLFYVYCLSISVANLIVIVGTPRGLATTLALIQRVLHSCLTSRILVHLRLASSRDSILYSVRNTNVTTLRSISMMLYVSPSSHTMPEGQPLRTPLGASVSSTEA
ncbi:hypothetical protein QCA50_016658 [Cerrena zonata]|uniref:DUF6533 domain-containing protein n=1 Tax=Cerrena zonata TaxID=2478898 RepID=A0AAW0FM83_9APHY